MLFVSTRAAGANAGGNLRSTKRLGPGLLIERYGSNEGPEQWRQRQQAIASLLLSGWLIVTSRATVPPTLTGRSSRSPRTPRYPLRYPTVRRSSYNDRAAGERLLHLSGARTGRHGPRPKRRNALCPSDHTVEHGLRVCRPGASDWRPLARTTVFNGPELQSDSYAQPLPAVDSLTGTINVTGTYHRDENLYGSPDENEAFRLDPWRCQPNALDAHHSHVGNADCHTLWPSHWVWVVAEYRYPVHRQVPKSSSTRCFRSAPGGVWSGSVARDGGKRDECSG